MARAIWSGAISFGLVNVPVKLVTAVRKKNVRFHQLHARDGARIQQRRVCSTEGVEVPYEEVSKGYELPSGEYVQLDAEELEALDPEASRTIDIDAFVSLGDIDPLYYDASYYLEPDERGEKAYRLLVDAMAAAGRVGIARFVLRNKQYLAALRPVEDALVLSTMNYPDEIVPETELDLPTTKVSASERELDMAQQLIASLSGDFRPEHYHDTYREKLLELIDEKAAGHEVVTPPPEAGAPAPVIDLMAALEASVKAVSESAAQHGDGESAAGGDGEEGGSGKGRRGRRTRAS